MGEIGPTREECLQQVRDLEQRLFEAQATIADLRRRLDAAVPPEVAVREAGQLLLEELETANEELQSQAAELCVQAEDLQVQAEELEMQNEELQRVSRELETEHALLRTVLEQMPAGVIIAEAPSGRFLLANQQMAGIIGRAVPMAKNLQEFDHYQGLLPDGRPFGPNDYPLAQSLSSGKKTLEQEISFNRADGSPGVIQVSASPVHDAQGKIIAGVATYQDITARKQAEIEIQRQASFPQLNPNPVLEVDTAGNIIYYNQAALEALGEMGEAPDLRNFLPGDLNEIFSSPGKTGQKLFQREIQVNGKFFLEAISFVEQFKVVRIYATDITERQRAEEGLGQSHKRTIDILESISDGFFSMDREMVVTYFNSAAARILGRDRDEVLGLNLMDAFPEARGSIFEEKYAEALREGKSLAFEAFFEPEPYRNWYEVRVFPFQDGISVYFQVTTERKKAEAALLRAKEDWERTFDAVPDLITVMDTDHHMVRVNRAMAQALGQAPQELAGKPCYEFMHQNHCIPSSCPHQQMLLDHREHSAEVRELGRDFLVTTSPIFDDQGKLFGSVHIARDITEQKRAEEALKDSEERFRTMANAIPQLAWTARSDGYIYWYNQRWYDYTGTTPEDMEGWGWQSVHDPEVLPQVLELWRTSIYTGRPFDMVFPLRGRDGQFHQFLTRVMPMKDAEGQVIQWFGTNTDITDRQRAEEKLRLSNQRLDLLAETAGRLLSSVSPQEVVDSLCRKVMDFLQCDAYFNFLVVDEKAGLMHLNACAGIPDEEARRIQWLEFGAAVCGCAARDACRIVAEDIQTTPDPRTELVKSYGIQAYACHPLLIEGRVLGTLSFGTRQKTSFSPDELALMKAVADQVAIAMDRKLAEERLRRLNEELEQLVRERTADLEETVAQLEEEISDREQAEVALAKERQRFYDVLEMLPAYLVLLTPDYHVPYANRFFTDRFGESNGMRCFEYLFGRTEPCEICHTYDVLKTNAPQRWEWTGPDGRNYDIYDFPFTDVDGSPLIMEMGIDITERKQAEKQVATIGRLYRVLSRVNETIIRVTDREALFQEACRIAVEDGLLRMAWIGLIDPDGRVVRPVAKYGHEEGYLDNLVITLKNDHECHGPTGTSVRDGRFDICNDFAADPRMAPWQERALARGYRSSGAFPLRVGEQVVGTLTIYADKPGFFNEEEIALLEALADDLSFAMESMEREAGRRRAEAEVQKLNEELEQRVKERTKELEAANREMESFSYSVSHDLKAPVRAIDGFSKMLLAEHSAKLDSEALRLLGVIRHNTSHMGQLIDDLLALSRLGRREIRKSRLDLAAMSAIIFNEMNGEAPEHQVEMNIKELPPAFGDPSLIRQALVNLLSNAFKFTKSREDATIEVGGWSHEGENVYYVKDNGIGFDMRYKDKLFGVFQRLHGQGEFEGTGVGLAIVQRILLRHGGRVWAEGKPGEGATFYFSLPVKN